MRFRTKLLFAWQCQYLLMENMWRMANWFYQLLWCKPWLQWAGRPLTFCLTSNFGGIFWQLDLYKSAQIFWSLTKTIPVNDFVLSLTKHKLIGRLGLVTHKPYPRNWLRLSLTKPPLISWHGLVTHKIYPTTDFVLSLTKPPLISWHGMVTHKTRTRGLVSNKTKSITWKGFVSIKTKSVTGIGFVSNQS